MSHFTVLVIGKNIAAQLAPYHEFECTGEDDQYVVDVDITDKIKARMTDEGESLNTALEYYGLESKIVSQVADVERDGDHKYGYAIVVDGELQKAVDRTNPNRKWDWYKVGGRWTGFFKLKPGGKGRLGRPGIFDNKPPPGTADIALKGDIDFAAMRDEAGREAGERWDRAHKITDQTWESWETMYHRFPGDVEKAREAYWGQPAVKALRKHREFSLELDHGLSGSREAYVEAARGGAVSTYAIVKDGEWIGKGEMGWFGMSRDETTQSEWDARVNELLDGLPDDTMLTLVDCHI